MSTRDHVKKEGDKILLEHRELKPILQAIPEQRQMQYREETRNGLIIGKPRFLPERYSWEPNLVTRLKNHLQNVWNYFETYSYWFDT